MKVYSYKSPDRSIDIPVYRFNRKDQFLPFDLPESSCGNFSIKKVLVKRKTKLPVVSLRNALFMGLRATQIEVEHPVYVHKLLEHEWSNMECKEDKGSLWMTSYPQEIEQHHRQLKRFEGNVLVGGLGLGLALSILMNNPKVKGIVCIEINGFVRGLVEKHLSPQKVRFVSSGRRSFNIIQSDLSTQLKTAQRFGIKFDYAFFDIWQPTGARVLSETVIPLRMLSRGVVPQENIECWNEDEMLGQVRLGLQMDVQLLQSGQITEAGLQLKVKDKLAWPFIKQFLKDPGNKSMTPEQTVKCIDRYIADVKHLRRAYRDEFYTTPPRPEIETAQPEPTW